MMRRTADTAAAAAEVSNQSRQLDCTNTNVTAGSRISSSSSSWLLSTIADLEERMKALVVNSPEDYAGGGGGDTFAERAESYYRQRPQLLSLLNDLYRAHLSLADRYSQALAKRHHRRRSSSQLSTLTLDAAADCCCYSDADADAESSLSFQPLPAAAAAVDGDAVVAELVMKCVEYDVVLDGIREAERRAGESGQKIELQRSLLEVLEAERLVLLGENARLGGRAAALEEENEALAAEAAALRRRAGELARCVLRMREEQRACLLGRRIEGLQAQVRALERRNWEYREMMLLAAERSSPSDGYQSRKRKKKNGNKSKSDGGDLVSLERLLCFHPQQQQQKQKQKQKFLELKEGDGGFNGGGGGGRRAGSWWERLRKNLELFQCVPRGDLA